MNNKLSFTSASAFPAKLLVNSDWYDGAIKPLHLQLLPTNKCPLDCSFCSCKDRDKTLELDIDDIKKHVADFSKLGGKAVTITGGGDPLAHKDINDIIKLFSSYNIEIGLVTNGILWDRLNEWDKLTWCRISISSENTIQDKWVKTIKSIPIDWAFSYVYTGDANDLQEQLYAAIGLPITHIRVVSDIYHPNHVPRPVKDDRIIYQDRDDFTKGTNCLIGLVKPVLAADGYYYPCCGTQYAINNSKRDMIEKLRLGNNLKDIIQKQTVFNGTVCDKCYYKNYNDILTLYTQEYKHKNFI